MVMTLLFSDEQAQLSSAQQVPLASCSYRLVNVDPLTRRPMAIPDDLVQLVSRNIFDVDRMVADWLVAML